MSLDRACSIVPPGLRFDESEPEKQLASTAQSPYEEAAAFSGARRKRALGRDCRRNVDCMQPAIGNDMAHSEAHDGGYPALSTRKQGGDVPGWVQAGKVLLLLFVFLLGVRALGDGFELLGKDALDDFFEATKNPFVGLAIGILSTSLVQSSSVTTSMVVALVAAPQNPLPVAHAIPMIMGANIGTTVTNTMVSLGHLSRPEEFRRAIAAGTCDDFFNLIVVGLLLPLELATGFLERISGFMVQLLPRAGDTTLPNPVATATSAILEPAVNGIRAVVPPGPLVGIFVLVLAAGLLFAALTFLVKELRKISGGRLQRGLRKTLGKTAWVGLAVGAIMTAIVQSSSLTLSVLVPFVGTGIVTLEEAFPIVLGANFGTTLTSLVAATASAPQTLQFAVQIALVHLLFNIIGTSLIYPVPRVRQIPLDLSRWIADVATKSKLKAMGYVVMLFYGLPALGLLVWQMIGPGGR